MVASFNKISSKKFYFVLCTEFISNSLGLIFPTNIGFGFKIGADMDTLLALESRSSEASSTCLE